MNGQIEKSAADTLLERGIPVKVNAPFFLRWFGKKVLHPLIRKPKFGTQLRVSSYYASTGIVADELKEISIDQANILFATHGKTLSKIIASSLINSRIRGYLFTKLLASYLRWATEPIEIFDLVIFLIINGGTKDFISTIRLAQNLTITAPMMSQTATGS
ncbi:MAG: hypothetical protein EOO42_01140 [Flavobacteriales bacterium]|nr:MAG: hypothetical protein EOO42_01140 [Flavobacteriales bacterium]